MTRTVIGVDTAKHVFALYWIDHETGETVSKTLRRGKFLSHFVGLAPLSCGHGSLWWLAPLGAADNKVGSRGTPAASQDGVALCLRRQQE